MKKAELLIPVGNKECLLAAIHNGADAVYLGGKRFGARAYSNNFDNEEMISAIKLCHLYGVKVYVTVNTMIYNEEVQDVIAYLNFLYANNVDAVIMQDNGLIELTRKLLPNLEVHVSTQAHNHNEAAIRHYKELGCARVVFDRESSLKSISAIKTDIEKEVFVYGALCICYSGNCLFSALNGGRSANRGMCVGSCRLPYTLLKDNKVCKNGYLLSTKDLNTLDHLKEILDARIDSLKIEGRMKSKEYVAVVTRTYRKLIDQYYNNENMILESVEKKNLLKTYNREFTKGYLFETENIMNDKSSNHQGIKIGTVIGVNNKRITIQLDEDIHQEDAIRFAKPNKGMYVNSLYNKAGLLVASAKRGEIISVDNKDRIMVKDILGSEVLKTIDFLLNKELNNVIERKVPIYLKFVGKIGENVRLTISDGINKVFEEGSKIEEARTSSVDENRITEQLSKLGSTPFKAEKIEIEIDSNIFINIKELNELRRKAVDTLIHIREGKTKSETMFSLPSVVSKSATKSKISILTRNENQLELAIRNNIDIIYTTNEELYYKYKEHKNVYLRLERVLEEHKTYRNERLLCTEFGSLVKYGQENKIRSDYYLNVANDYTISKFKKLNTEAITLSVEAEIEQLNKIRNKEDAEIIVYGRLECMVIKNNIFDIKDEKTYLVDEKGNKYPVIYENDRTHIFNSKPVNIIDKMKKMSKIGTYRIELFDEDIYQIQSIIKTVQSMIQ